MYISLSKIREPRDKAAPPTPGLPLRRFHLSLVSIPSCHSWSVSAAQGASRFLGNCSSPSPNFRLTYWGAQTWGTLDLGEGRGGDIGM